MSQGFCIFISGLYCLHIADVPYPVNVLDFYRVLVIYMFDCFFLFVVFF